jgi:CubicO group peptidase (beta-lactamase class C family)
LDDPVDKYLPAGVHAPSRNGKAITLIDLATHTSGLPRMPTNFKPSNPLNPYADYTDDQLFSFLSGYTLQKDVGVHYEYSNLGAALLGQALARHAGLSYEALAKRDIIDPLHMTSTAVTLTPSMKGRMTVGHDAALAATPYWDLPTFAGAGALRSDADDMLTFLGAELGYVTSPLAEAMRAQRQPRRPTGRPGLDVSLAWHVRSVPGGEIIWHNGGTGGYRTFMGFDARAGVGVVVLTNAATEAGGDDIGFHLLTGSPLTKPPKDFKAITLPSAALEPFVGRYDVAPIGVLDIRREGDHLLVTAPDKTTLTMTPESPKVFFVKVVNAEIVFDLGADGRATGFVLHQNGSDLHGQRIP